MNLQTLGEATSFSPDKIRYFISFLKEIEASEFVAELCQAAYNIGFEDGNEEVD